MSPEELLYQSTWRIIDHSHHAEDFDALHSFAMDDTLCTSIGRGLSLPTARTWVHQNTVVLGIQDAKLPFIKGGMDYLQAQGYRVIVRNSGGLAVPLDEGVLNITLVFSEQQQVSIDRGYAAMVTFIKRMLESYNVTIATGEIEKSYCPGKYDLSIDGKKFAGISQRRIRSGIAVQIYLCVNGSGQERARLLKNFYEQSLAKWDTKITFPDIDPTCMASLSELLEKDLNIKALMSLFVIALKHYSSATTMTPLDTQEYELFQFYDQRVRKRHNKALHLA